MRPWTNRVWIPWSWILRWKTNMWKYQLSNLVLTQVSIADIFNWQGLLYPWSWTRQSNELHNHHCKLVRAQSSHKLGKFNPQLLSTPTNPLLGFVGKSVRAWSRRRKVWGSCLEIYFESNSTLQLFAPGVSLSQCTTKIVWIWFSTSPQI